MCWVQMCCPVQLEPRAPLWAPSGAECPDTASQADFALCFALVWISWSLPAAPTPVSQCCSKPAVKLCCCCWTHINLQALQKLVGKLKSFLGVRRKSLTNDKEENRSQWDTQWTGKIFSFTKSSDWGIPQRKESKVLPTWQWMTAFLCTVPWQLHFLRCKWEKTLTLFPVIAISHPNSSPFPCCLFLIQIFPSFHRILHWPLLHSKIWMTKRPWKKGLHHLSAPCPENKHSYLPLYHLLLQWWIISSGNHNSQRHQELSGAFGVWWDYGLWVCCSPAQGKREHTA